MKNNRKGSHDLVSLIRSIPDYPKPGVLFRDITPLLQDKSGLRKTTEMLASRHHSLELDKVAGIEARGLIFGAALAYEIGCGFVVIRKPGRLPAKTVSENYELEYGNDTLEMHADAVDSGERVLLVDDLLATGGTASASARLLGQCGAQVVGCAFVIELLGLPGRRKLEDEGLDVHAIMELEAG